MLAALRASRAWDSSSREIAPLGVDILTPDFAAMARSCHVAYHTADTPQALHGLLQTLVDSRQPVMIELDAAHYLQNA